MKDIDEFMEYCNRLDHQGLINLIEGMYVEDIMEQERFEILGKAFELACKELEDMDSTLFDLYDRLDEMGLLSDSGFLGKIKDFFRSIKDFFQNLFE